MPQVKTGADGRSPVGVVVKENMPFKARLRKRYKPTDFVRVINIDNIVFQWNFFPPDGEEETFTDDGKMRQIFGRRHFDKKYETLLPGNDQLWEIEPGKSEVLIGANADLFISGLYKVMVAKKTIGKIKRVGQGQARKFNWNDGALQEEFIDKIFLGVAEPEFRDAEPNTTTANA